MGAKFSTGNPILNIGAVWKSIRKVDGPLFRVQVSAKGEGRGPGSARIETED